MDLAQANRADLTFLHVIDPDSSLSRPDAVEALSALAPNGESLVPPVYTSVAHGHLIEEILHSAASIRADWIVVGVGNNIPLLSLEDSTAYKILTVADCPVLTFRHAASTAKHPQANQVHWLTAAL